MTTALIWTGFCVWVALGAALTAWACELVELAVLAADFTRFMLAEARAAERKRKPIRWFTRIWWTFISKGVPPRIGYSSGALWTGFRQWYVPPASSRQR
ncbi:hypothetical protein ABXN37_22455 [Piscinibacter sakaiensis]|nr:hypothetical protein [Piscinibacter sakaiensis]